MHYLHFTIIENGSVKNSLEARREALGILHYEDDSEEGGDEGVIGGRWSSMLQQLELGINFYDEIEKIIPKDGNPGWSMALLEKKEKIIQQKWEEFGGKYENPFRRDQYAELGYEDDAMILTEKLVEKIKDKKFDVVEIWDDVNSRDIEDNSELDKLIGEWIVVIDFHT